MRETVIVCGACGSRTRTDRVVCPRCHTALAAAPPLSKGPHRLVNAALLGTVLMIGAGVWLRDGPPAHSRPAPLPASASPTPGSSAPTLAVPEAATGAAPEAETTLMDPQAVAAVAYADGDHAASQVHYEAALRKNPDDAESLSNLGQVLVRSGKVEEALPYFDRAISLIPQRWAYRFNRARALGVLGRTKEAVADYRIAQGLFPNDYATAFNLGLALHKLGDEAGAIEAYRRAIELDPNDGSFHLALGTSLERVQRRAEAAAAYAEYLRLAPAAPDAQAVRERVAQLTGTTPSSSGPSSE